MTHIDDWLDVRHEAPPTDSGEQFAHVWLEEFRKPAGAKNYRWLESNPLFCTYRGKRWRCIGASRLGDVWLTADFSKVNGYDLRIDVADCTNWSKEP